MQQLDPEYLHVRQGKTGVLDYVFERYLAEAEPKGQSFIEWVEGDAYDPAATTMKPRLSALGALIAALAFGTQAHAALFSFQASGGPFDVHGVLTVQPNVSSPDPNPLCGTGSNDPCRADPPGAYRITGITGRFTDAADGIFDASITGLIPINPANERDPLLGNPFDPLVPSPASASWMPRPWISWAATIWASDDLFFPDRVADRLRRSPPRAPSWCLPALCVHGAGRIQGRPVGRRRSIRAGHDHLRHGRDGLGR